MKRQKNKEYSKLKRKINFRFILFNIISALILFSCVAFSVLNNCIWKTSYLKCQTFDELGVLCQVITAIVSFVTSIIGIAISLQNDTCFGISVRKFNGLRKKYHYSIKSIILLAITFIALNLTFFMLHMVVACIGIAVVAILFCVYISCTEIPIMTKNETTLVSIIKKQLMLQWKKPTEDSKEMKDVLKCLIVQEYNLKQTYSLLKDKSKEYNKYLMLKLLDLQADLAFNLENIEEGQKRCEIVDGLIENISDILRFNLDLFEILQVETKEYIYLITRVLFRTVETKEGNSKTTRLISGQIVILNYAKFDEQKKQFIMQVVLSMLTISVANNEFDFLNHAKKEFSQCRYQLGKNNSITLLFALISLQLYYLSTSAQNVTMEMKNNINRFLDENIVIDKTKVESWRKLYKTFSSNFSLEFDAFVNYFIMSEHNFDVPLYGGGAYFVVLDIEYVLKWYLAHLFHSQIIGDFDYNKLLIDKIETSYYLKKAGDVIFKDSKEIMLPKEYTDIIGFFLPQASRIKWFELFENKNHHFRDFIGKLHISDLEDKSTKSKLFTNEEIAKKYEIDLIKLIYNEWGYDSSIDVTEEPTKCLNLLTEKASDAINYDECIIDFFSFNIFQEIKRNTPNHSIITKGNLDENIKLLLKENVVLISNDANLGLSYFLKDEKIKLEYEKMCKSVKNVESHIFDRYAFFIETAFSFNFEIVDFKAMNLSQEQIAEKVKEYQRADGQYIYEGAFLSREQIERYVSEQFVILSMCAKYKVLNNGHIKEIDPFSDNDKNEIVNSQEGNR